MDGTTFSPHGSVTSADGKDVSVDLRSEPVQRMAEICVLCNDAKVVYNAVGHRLFYSASVCYREFGYRKETFTAM